MLTRKNIKISRTEALKYLMLESAPVFSIISSCLSAIFVFGVLLAFLYISRMLPFSYESLIITESIMVVFGAILYLIRRQEFELYEKTSTDVFLSGVFSYPVLILLFVGILSYFLIPQWKDAEIINTIITVFVLSLILSFVFYALWELLTFILLGVLARKDWFLMAEKDYFVGVLGLRFEEAKRYGVPLSIVSVNFVNTKNKRVLALLYQKIATSLRDIDTITHFDSFSNFIMLSPITNIAAQGLLDRLVKLVDSYLQNKQIGEDIVMECGISSISPECQTEYDLLKTKMVRREEFKKK